MKLTHILIGFGSTLVLGACVNYPKNYTYSPTVVVKSGGENSSPIVLPNPFATNKSTANYNVNGNAYNTQRYYEPEPSPLTAVVSRPPVAVNYYYDSENGVNYEQPVEEMELEAF